MSNKWVWAIFLCWWILPQGSVAATFTQQVDTFTPDTISNVTEPDTIFGALDGFPHTYTFTLQVPTEVRFQLGVVPAAPPVSFLVVRNQARGVEEVTRTDGTQTDWTQQFNWYISRSITYSPAQTIVLAPGSYKLEVSNAANTGQYQLEINGGAQPGFLRSLRDTFAVHAFYGSWVTAFFSWQVVVLLLSGALAWWWLRRILS